MRGAAVQGAIEYPFIDPELAAILDDTPMARLQALEKYAGQMRKV